MEKDRHIGPKLQTQSRQLTGIQPQPPQAIQGPQRGRRIRAAAPQSGARQLSQSKRGRDWKPARIARSQASRRPVG